MLCTTSHARSFVASLVPIFTSHHRFHYHHHYYPFNIMMKRGSELKNGVAKIVGQTAIVNFFKPLSTSPRQTTKNKRSASDISNGDNSQNENDAKRLKQSENDKPPNNGNSPTLTDEQKQIIDEKKIQARIRLQAKRTPALSVSFGTTWFKALEKEFTKDYFQKLSNFLESERKRATIYPPDDQVYSWTLMCDMQKVKIVILGQDPYHGPKQAHGLAFSVPKGVAIPKSLENIYRELSTDIAGFQIPTHGNLTGWAKQGVLLLNACLTVRAHCANSHKDQGWEQFTDAVIKSLNDHSTHLVFMLWGSYAQKKGAFIDKKRHLVLQCAHPSPLSASRGFFGCHHFSKANEYLEKHGKKPIDWGYLPLQVVENGDS